jgi:multiple sugar transport system substrate-binding protein
VASETPGLSLRTRLTVARLTPACCEQYLQMTLDPKYIVKFSQTQGVVPSTAEAAALTKEYAPGGRLALLADLVQKHSRVRPATPVFPIIDTVYNKAIGDIIAGANVKATLDKAAAEIDDNIKANGGYRSR